MSINKIKTYPIHEFAALVPMASLDEQAALNKDILENGLHEPIMLWGGQVVDGRCRQIACKLAGEKIRIKDLDSNLTEEEVKTFVKSVNIRRNLTFTQKVIVACKSSLEPDSKRSVKDTAATWGISKPILDNARFIARERPEFVKPLFDGKSVNIINKDGQEVQSNKITAIFAYCKRSEENGERIDTHAWNVDSEIKTQRGKEWYYNQQKDINNNKLMRILISELANFKFPKNKKD